MNFKGHASAGLVTATVTGMAAYAALPTPDLSVYSTPLPKLLAQLSGGLPIRLDVFLLTFFMALFPDLDTSSISQRWFFRCCFLLLGILFYYRVMDLFAVVAFASLLPVLHKHRGWTHWKITPWAMSLGFIIILEYFRSRNTWFSAFSWQNVFHSLSTHFCFICACVLGHYTHLLLDSRWIGKIPLLSNNSNHH